MCKQAPPSEIAPTAADNMGVIVIACDCSKDEYHYQPDIGEKLAGVYDARPFWRILFEDGVASEEDVSAIRSLLTRARTDRAAAKEKLFVSLLAADRLHRYFTLRVAIEYGTDGRAETLRILLIDAADEMGVSEQLQLKAITDDLTGLLLRNVFLERVEKRMRAAAPGTYVIVYFDIDKFSVINERYGHRRGDRFLRFVADTAVKTCDENSLVSRINADCFAVCTEYDPVRIEQFLQKYRETLRGADVPFEINISFGLCVINDLSLSADALLDHAALAQRSIKGSYVTRYAYYDDALRRIRLRRQEIESEMTAALTQGQFDIYIQPQFELSSGKLIGGESLARWFHPERGLIMPGEFIPIFEQNGFVCELDSYVWERACQVLRGWIAESDGESLSLSVNISRVSLHNLDVVERLCSLTEQYGVPPRLLRLEVTESAYADNPQQLIEVVNELQERGFTVEMDDFGSGYSSLNTLKDVPVSALKLDLRFLAGDTVSGRGGSIINSIIRMARWLQLPVMAEGVETQQQEDYLHSVGCDFVQGYLHARPMPVTEFETLARQYAFARYDKASSYVDMADANAFWNPDSQETLIFNSYVGGAAIMEYANQRVELLRANEKFRAMMRMEDIDRYVYILEDLMFPEDRALFIKMLDDAIETHDETTCTTRLHDAEKGDESCFWLRNRARVICESRNATIFYIAIEDVTAEYEAQRRFHISQGTLMAAAAHTHLQYWTYDMIRHTSIQGVESHEYESGVPDYLENYPQSLIDMGYIHPDYVDAYLKLHTDLQAGARSVSLDALTGGEGKWEWRKVRYTAVTDEDGVVRSAIGTSESLSAYKELEERFLITARQGGLLTWVLDINERSIRTDMLAKNSVLKQTYFTNMPERYLEMGIVHPDDAATFSGAYYRMYDGESEATAVARCKAFGDVNGEWRWYRLTFTATADKDGRTGYAVCTGTDVTEQVNMQARYHEAMAYYENLDPNEYISILHANITKGTVQTQSGGTASYMHALHLLTQRIDDEEERARIETALLPDSFAREYAKGASRFVYEYRLRMEDGALRWVRTTVRLLMDTSRQELCAFIYTMDINADKMKTLVFERIVLEDYDFVTIIDTVHDRYLTFVTDSSDEFIPSAEKYSFSDAAEVSAHMTAPEEDMHDYIRFTRIPYMQRRLEEEGVYSFYYRHKQPDGSLRLKRMTLRLIDKLTKHVCLTRLDIERVTKGE